MSSPRSSSVLKSRRNSVRRAARQPSPRSPGHCTFHQVIVDADIGRGKSPSRHGRAKRQCSELVGGELSERSVGNQGRTGTLEGFGRRGWSIYADAHLTKHAPRSGCTTFATPERTLSTTERHANTGLNLARIGQRMSVREVANIFELLCIMDKPRSHEF